MQMLSAELAEQLDRYVFKQPDATRYRREPYVTKKLFVERACRHITDLRSFDSFILEAAVQNSLEGFNYGT
jgi:hypothetical protein